jgi:uncharacterized protein YabN with tetrapyrrole methylase and pyrophosphatase domain
MNESAESDVIFASDADSEVELYLLGSGTASFLDITLRTQDALKRCQQVFYLHDIPSLDEYLRHIAPGAVNLIPIYYRDGRERTDIYRDISVHVVDAVASGAPVGFLVHGNPMFFSLVTRLILARAGERGVRAQVLPAVSSLDSLFVELRLDAGADGLQLFEASTAMLRDIALNPRVAALLLQVGAILDFTSTRQSETVQDVTPLRDYLLRFYPPEHEVTVAECQVELGFSSTLTTVNVRCLQDAASAMNYNATLYVPAIEG